MVKRRIFLQVGLGFDVGNNLSGPGKREDVFGHTGSTGTLCWVDPTSKTICVILTTLPSRGVTPHPRNGDAQRVVEVVGQPIPTTPVICESGTVAARRKCPTHAD
ncbi:MAG: beta-lactamase family protein [Fuerstiella sp.]|nr:beta-lactamase family protein [Fuerstiella sp.]MCP4853737.1 beta-lactamase family protein [Fuerstiella sp.]